MPLRFVVLWIMLFGASCSSCNGESAKSHRAIADFNAISATIKAYQINAGELPPPGEGLMALVERPDSLSPDKPWSQLLNKVPLDPWNNPYRYLAGDSFKGGFGLYSCGADGVSASIGNDPDDWNSWSSKPPDEALPAKTWRFIALVGGVVIAAGAFLLGYRVAKKESHGSPGPG